MTCFSFQRNAKIRKFLLIGRDIHEQHTNFVSTRPNLKIKLIPDKIICSVQTIIKYGEFSQNKIRKTCNTLLLTYILSSLILKLANQNLLKNFTISQRLNITLNLCNCYSSSIAGKPDTVVLPSCCTVEHHYVQILQEFPSQKVFGYLGTILCAVGLVTNFFNIIVFRNEMISPLNTILAAVAICDFIGSLVLIPYLCTAYLEPFRFPETKCLT